MTSERAIVRRRFSPPESVSASVFREMFDAELGQKLLAAVLASLLAESCRLEYGHDVFMDGELSKYRFLLRQVAHILRARADTLPFR